MPSPVPGQTFGRYVVDAFVARGGMGEIYRATDAALRRSVALKVMSQREAEAEGGVTRFLREARLAAELSHPHIVVVYEAGQVDDTLYLAMEWLEGLTLRALLDRSSMTLAQRIQVIGSIADALAYAHERGVVHRDVKPSNVIVDAYGRPKLLDFGIAKRARVIDATFQTGDGAILGTPLYMAPEQRHTSNVTEAADQFAWALVAYETITGRHPREVTGSHFPFGVAHGLPWPDGMNRAQAAVVERAMRPDPVGRFASMRLLLSAWSSLEEAPTATVGAGGTAPRRDLTVPDTRQDPNPLHVEPRSHQEGTASRMLPFFIGVFVVLATSIVSVALAVRIRRGHPESASAAEATVATVVGTAPPLPPQAIAVEEPPSPVATLATPKRSAAPHATKASKGDPQPDPPTVVVKTAAPSGPPRPATFNMASPHRRSLEDPEIAAAAAAARDVDACVAQHGGLVSGDQIYVRVQFGEHTRIVAGILQDVPRPVPAQLRACVDTLLARLPFQRHSAGTIVSFAYDF